MMVGSELPSPETRTSTVRDDAVLELRGPHRGTPRTGAPLSTTSA